MRAVADDRRQAWSAALLAAAGYGVIAGWWMPRGPLSTLEGLSSMALGLLVGIVAGLLLRTRWAMLVAPVTFAVVFELVRSAISGPTVDGIHLTSAYGVMAFAVGRGVHGLLALVPLALGAGVGAAMARRPVSARRRRGFMSSLGLWLRRGVAGVTAVALVALAAVVARAATTEPIADASGRTVAGSVAELTRVPVGGHDLALMIRGRSVRNPVLLFLAGGPGGSELGAMRRHSQALEDDFVVATLDQRGAGKSYDQLDPAGTVTLERAVTDALGVTEYLRHRFAQGKVYLAGQSWGTLLGVLAVQRRPELFSAFVGVGQMVDPAETDQIFYRDTLAWARRTGNADLVATLVRNGPPPYRSMLDYEPALSYEQEVYPYNHAGNSEGAGQMGENIFVREYTLLEQLHLFGGFMDTSSVLYPQIQHLDFRTQATSLAVPVYLALGAHEAPGRAEPAKQWFHEQREHGRGDCAAEVADDGTLIIAAVALALPSTGYGFLLSAGAVVRLLAAAALAGALGAVLGAGRRHRHRCSSSDRRRRGRLRNRPERTGGRGRRLRCGCTTRRRVRRQGRRGDLATGGR